jgi:hypothetical protein
MPLWAKVDVDMPTDGKLFGQPVSTRFLWLCLICLAKKQDAHGEIAGFDCSLLASAYNLSRKAVADALTHYQASNMVELDVDGTIRLLNFDKRQGSDDTTLNRSARYYESHRETVLAKRKVSRASSHAVSRETTVRTPSEVSRKTFSLEQSRGEEEVEQSRADQEQEQLQKPSPPTASRPPTAALWEAYSAAYEKRYGAEPVRNATVNGQLAAVVKRLGAEEAPEVAAFYVAHKAAFYAQKGHPVGLLLLDAEKLRTEWVTGRQITSTAARQQERTAANGQVWDSLLKGEKHGVG